MTHYHQVTQEASTRNGGFTDNFGYDSAGNPTTFKGVTKSYNSNNQQTGSGLAYDGNGNPTTYGGTTLTFDPENRLTAYGSVLTAAYTGDGLRAWKQNSSGRTYFLYDGIVPVAELDASGAVTATNSFGASGLVSRNASSMSVFYSFDSEGNVAQRSDASGTVLSNYLFSAHGSVLSGTLTDPFGYKAQFGYYTDTDTGLQLLTHRYYDPSTGRFLTRDPISYRGGINLYSYVRNRPETFVDPLGHDLWGFVGGAGGGAAVGGLGIMGSASYLIGANDNNGESGPSYGGAGNVGLAAGPQYGYPSNPDGSGGLGAMFGAGGGLFWSNARHFRDLAGRFETTIIGTPFGVGVEIDKSGPIYVISIAYGKGWGAGVFHYTTNTPCWTIWETTPGPKPPPSDERDYPVK